MQCDNMTAGRWKLDGDCSGKILCYERRRLPGERALIAELCDKHAVRLAKDHPDWQLKETRLPF